MPAVLCLLWQAPAASAQSYPSRQVLVICALGAGSGPDITARLYSERLQKRFGQPFVVENRPGAAQMVAVDSVKKALPDGYTLGVYTSAAMAIRPTMMKKPTYDPTKDFIPIAQYLKSPFVLVADPNLPVRSVADLVKYVKSQPGKVSYAVSGIGSAPHLAGEYFAAHAGIALAAVPYKQSPQAFQDVAAGHIPLSFADAGTALALITGGKLRALAVTTAARLPTLPDVPTLAEALNAPNLELVSWHVLSAPANTPAPIVVALHEAMKHIMADPELTARVAGLGLLPHPVPPVAETQAYIRSEIEKWGAVVRKLGLSGTI
ncbi:MAG: tripartite tricarboxylate transporter substrate binding protein [Hyphomicrobiales bacterium]|nr:tripartite tricarboxylate transporter substrate binding protein [Hyphomicrobiales bacterium]